MHRFFKKPSLSTITNGHRMARRTLRTLGWGCGRRWLLYIATAAERTKRENPWIFVLNSSGPNGTMNERADYHEAIKNQRTTIWRVGKGQHKTPYQWANSTATRSTIRLARWRIWACRPTDLLEVVHSESISKLFFFVVATFFVVAGIKLGWTVIVFFLSQCQGVSLAGNRHSFVSDVVWKHYTDTTHTSHSRTCDFSHLAQYLSHRVNRSRCVSQNSHSSHLAQHCFLHIWALPHVPHALQSDFLPGFRWCLLHTEIYTARIHRMCLSVPWLKGLHSARCVGKTGATTERKVFWRCDGCWNAILMKTGTSLPRIASWFWDIWIPTMKTNQHHLQPWRQLLVRFGAWMGFCVAKGDVCRAFLQGRKLQQDLWVLPVPELAAGFNVSPGEIEKLKMTAYGLMEAPVQWYISISAVLAEGTRLAFEIWPLLLDIGWSIPGKKAHTARTRSECPVVCRGHVDDCAFVGKEGNKVWETARKQVQDHFRWKMWEYDNFIHCGVRVEHQTDGVSQKEQNWEDCWVDWVGNVNRQVHNTVLPHQRSRIEQATVSVHYGSKPTPSGSQGRQWKRHTNLQFP